MRILALGVVLAGLVLAQQDGFVSLMPKSEIGEHWIVEGPAETWSVRDGMIYCAGMPNGFLRSRKSYKNFVFRADWRFIAEGWTKGPEEWPNAGFFINAGAVNDRWPMSLEVQGHYGEAGSLFGVRGGKVSGARRGPIDEHRIPFGEWDHVQVTQKDGKVTIVLNGRPINEGHDIYPTEGNICLQAEGWPLYYRNLEVKDLGE